MNICVVRHVNFADLWWTQGVIRDSPLPRRAGTGRTTSLLGLALIEELPTDESDHNLWFKSSWYNITKQIRLQWRYCGNQLNFLHRKSSKILRSSFSAVTRKNPTHLEIPNFSFFLLGVWASMLAKQKRRVKELKRSVFGNRTLWIQ